MKPTNRVRGRKILIYAYTGEGFVHKNIAASVKALEEICADLKIITEVSDTTSVLTTENLSEFDAIIFCNTNAEAFSSQQQKDAFRDYIRSGGGFIGIHSANTSEPDWPWFREMIGGVFLRHPKLQEFEIRVVNGEHI
jgi:type 1 glutamine amidotransferase